MEKKVRLGSTYIDLKRVVRDPRGVEHLVEEAITEDWSESRYVQFETKLYPFPEAADIWEWDSFLLERYPPLYIRAQDSCNDCPQGPCSLGVGKCGLTIDGYQARLSLRRACHGCLSQFIESRELLNYALKAFGREKGVGFGQLQDHSDYTSIGVLTGQYVKNLGDLDIALSYAEGQLAKLLWASYSATGDANQIEAMSLHAGSLLFLAMDVAEMIKISCFGFTNAGDQLLTDLIYYPLANLLAGMGSVERGKPVILFVGDGFLPAWQAVEYIKKNGLEVEIAGIGPVGHDLIRFYDKARLIGPMTQAAKIIRTGLADVIVATTSCLPIDIVSQGQKVKSPVIWASPQPLSNLPDRTDAEIEEIVRELVAGGSGVWIRDVAKVAEVAVRVAVELKREKATPLSLDKAREEAGRCGEDCDICFRICPNGLLIGKAIRELKEKGLKSLVEIEKGCFFCGNCEEVCPQRIGILDLIVAALGERASEDKFVMGAGRGPIPRAEASQWALSSMWGNCPGGIFIIGCGDGYAEDLAWIAYEIVSRNCITFTAGWGAGELGRYFNKEEGKFIYQQFTTKAQPRNLINCGGCSACAHLMDISQKYARIGTHISHYANFAESADLCYNLLTPVLIFWGCLPERAYALASGFGRGGVPVIIGPYSAFGFKRFLWGNKWDWRGWWTYDTWGKERRYVEPAPKHMIIPVETKEEAVTLAISLLMRAIDLRDSRLIRLDTYCEFHDKFFGGLPDDLHLFIASGWELPPRYKMKILKRLKEEHGWEVERIVIKRAKHPDGRLLTLDEFDKQYSARTRPITKLPRLLPKGGSHDSKGS